MQGRAIKMLSSRQDICSRPLGSEQSSGRAGGQCEGRAADVDSSVATGDSRVALLLRMKAAATRLAYDAVHSCLADANALVRR
jgi:hypothetical protein